ncbi:brain protein I3 isoform X1 [Electrophorus electricus]|uniref:brain protein I3 isoform X1 n=1 Tax=Electrophorus electricus TaxID=8005 RepID=UPI000F0A7FC8|nr:brain protein I3 isoform X1 [Electrophorus electricus]XP_035384196.1 brain protein I3 isoform X1 [Electrophorus electricus]
MDNKPLLQDRPPAYNIVPGALDYGQQNNYGAIPPHAPAPGGFHSPPPPYPFPDAQGKPTSAGYPASVQAAPVGQQPNYANTYTIIQPSVVVVGGCPACRVGVLEDDFTCLGIMCAILFFPLGILFCLALRQRRCPNCGATFG